MTETDRIYIAIIETMKKYGIEQSIGALTKYMCEGNAQYFTSEKNARQIISELSPGQVLQNALISSVKYQQIVREKGYAQVLPNQMIVEQSIAEFRKGYAVSAELTLGDAHELITRMLSSSVSDTIQLLAQNPDVLESFLGQYVAIVCNHRESLNKIPNENFVNINQYFSQFEEKQDLQR